MTGPSQAAFLSYASQDAGAAQRICDALRAERIEVWFDRSELRGGDAWDQSIRKQIKTCGLFVPIISKHTHERAEGYFRLEWKLAVDRSHLMVANKAFLVPVVIDETTDDENVPEKFREVQWTRLPGGVTQPDFIARIKLLLSPASPTIPQSRDDAPSKSSPIPSTAAGLSPLRRALPIAVAALALATFANLLSNKPWISKPAAPPATPNAAAPPEAPPNAFNPPPHSVAVLPFTNLSGDPKQEYFSDGVTEELINALSHIDALHVAARTSSFAFKDQNVDIGAIARKLGVGAILEGSIRRSGNTVRITAQLINAADGFHIWSEDYDRNLKDVLALQTDIATSVARRLQAQLVGDETAKIEDGGTHNPQAYNAYLRGTQLMATAHRESDFRAALGAFDQALLFDPTFAAAYAQRARALRDLADSSDRKYLSTSDHLYSLARESAERAVTLAPNFADAHAVLGWFVRMRYQQYAEATQELHRAMSLAPGNAFVLGLYGSVESMFGHGQVAVEATRRALLLDPLNYQAKVGTSRILYLARRFQEAITAADELRLLKPDDASSVWVIAMSYLGMGRPDDAMRICESSSQRMDEADRYECLALAYHAIGRFHEAADALEKLRGVDGDGGSFLYAEVHAQWGQPELALRWLVKAAQQREAEVGSLPAVWTLDPIRSEPKFKALERRLNFPP